MRTQKSGLIEEMESDLALIEFQREARDAAMIEAELKMKKR